MVYPCPKRSTQMMTWCCGCVRETIRTRIIPHAVKWYTGEANEEDEDDEDDEEDFDEDDDDDEVSADSSSRTVPSAHLQ